jgi:hypothetical protein
MCAINYIVLSLPYFKQLRFSYNTENTAETVFTD